MSDLSYENVARTIEDKVKKEVTQSVNVLKQYFTIGKYRGGKDMTTIRGPLERTRDPEWHRSGDEHTSNLGKTNERDGTLAADRNKDTTDTPLSDVSYRRRMGNRQVDRLRTYTTRAEAQVQGRAQDKLIKDKTQIITEDYHWTMLLMMIRGLDGGHYENPIVAGLGSGGNATGRYVPFPESYRHMVVGGGSAAEDPTETTTFSSRDHTNKGATLTGQFTAPFTLNGLDSLLAEISNATQTPGMAGELAQSEFPANPDPAVDGTYARGGRQDILGLSKPKHLVIMGHDGFAAWKSANRTVAGQSEWFNKGVTLLSWAKTYRYGDTAFITVPDVMIPSTPVRDRSGGTNASMYADDDGSTRARVARDHTMGFTARTFQGSPRTLASFIATMEDDSSTVNDRVTAARRIGIFPDVQTNAGAERNYIRQDLDVIMRNFWRGDSFDDAFAYSASSSEQGLDPTTRFRGEGNILFSRLLSFPSPSHWGAYTNGLVNGVKRRGNGNYIITNSPATSSVTASTTPENNYYNYSAPLADMHMAYIVDTRAMEYKIPEALNLKLDSVKDKDTSFEWLHYAEYHLSSKRLYDPLVRTVHFTGQGQFGGFYKETPAS